MTTKPSPTAVAVFSGKSIEHVLRDGGSQSWRLLPRHARRSEYLVCCRSAVDWVEGNEKRGSAFLIGRISGVVNATDDPRKDRWLVQLSEYAEIAVMDVWKGWRNPVKYGTLEELGIDLTGVKFKPMPGQSGKPLANKSIEASPTATTPPAAGLGTLTIAQAKPFLARMYGVSEDAIEITIRG